MQIRLIIKNIFQAGKSLDLKIKAWKLCLYFGTIRISINPLKGALDWSENGKKNGISISDPNTLDNY